MKKKLLSFIFAICLIIPCVIVLGACKDKEFRMATEKDIQVYAEYDDESRKLERIALKVSDEKTTAYLYGGGSFEIDWSAKNSGGAASGPIKKLMNSDNEIVSYYANLLYNYKYSFKVPSSVTRIDSYAFSYTSLTDVEMDSIFELGTNPFEYCKDLETIKITDSFLYDTRNNCNAILKDNEIVAGCKNSVIPSTATSIGDNAFRGSSIEELNIPNTITKIGEYAFCDSTISNITLPNTITSIGKYAFMGCEKLQNIQLPTSLNTINQGLFKDSGLVSFKITNAIEEIEYGVIEGCKNIQTIDIGDFSGEITPALLFGGLDIKRNLVSIAVSSTNTKYTDNNDSNIIVNKDNNELIIGCKNSVLDNSIQIIGNNAFANTTDLTTITLPTNLIEIGAQAFYNTGLYEVKFNDMLTTIGYQAFRGTKLKKITLIKDNLTIAHEAFSDIDTFEYAVVSSRFNIENIFRVSYISSNLPIVYYYGTSAEFANNENGYNLSESLVYFYSETEPQEFKDFYWHYDVDGVTPIKW